MAVVKRTRRESADEPATYVYCLVRDRRPPSLTKVPRGLPGAGRPRLLVAGAGVWLVVANVGTDDYNERTIETGLKDPKWVSTRALAHEAIVEQFTSCAALAPMKLFTIFSGDARAVQYISGRRTRVTRALDRVSGCEEWGVRIDAGTAPSRVTAPRKPIASGKGFLERKQQLRDDARTERARERRQGDQVYRSLRRHARAASRREPLQVAGASRRVVLDAAYLVPAHGTSFRAAVREWARRLKAGGFNLSLTGPWPPYHFVSASR